MGGRICKRVRMDGNKEVCLFISSDLGTFAVGQIIITTAHQFPLKIWIAVEQTFNFLGQLQNHNFLSHSSWPQRTGILTTMTCINSDDNSAIFLLYHLIQGATDHPFIIKQINHQTITVLLICGQGKALWADGATEIQHHSHAGFIAHGGTNTSNRSIFELQAFEGGFNTGVLKIHHQTTGVLQRKNIVLNSTAEIQNQPGFVRRAPQSHRFYIRSP